MGVVRSDRRTMIRRVSSWLSSQRKLHVAAALIVLLSAGLALRGPTFSSDSPGYLLGRLYRAPVLPFALAILRGVFGQGHFLRAFVFVQALAAFSSSTWLGFEIPRFLGARRGGLLLAVAL